MKKTLFILLNLFVVASSYAQTDSTNIPKVIHLTAVARDTASPYNPITNNLITVRLQVYNGNPSNPSSTLRYCKIEQDSTNSFGEFYTNFGNDVFGSSTLCADPIDSVDWSKGNIWYVISFTKDNIVSHLQPIDTEQFTTIPYAYAAHTAEQLVNVGSPPDTGATLTWSGSTWMAGNNPWSNYLLAEEQEPAGTYGGTSAAAGWQQRKLNFLVSSSGSSISLDTTTWAVTLWTPGVYYVQASAPTFSSGHSVLEIQNPSMSITYINGSSEFSLNSSSSSVQTSSVADGFISVGAIPVTFILNQYTSNSWATNGLGFANGVTTEVYSKVFVQKIY